MEIITGRKVKPFNIVLVGIPGIGKTTFATKAPKPIFLGAEENDEADCARFKAPGSWDDFKNQVKHLKSQAHDYKTVVVDSIDSVEKLLHRKIIADDPKQTGSMATAFGGYGKAFERAEIEMISARDILKSLRDDKGMNIILIAHSKKTSAADTILGLKYDTYELNLHQKVQAIFVDWCSAVLFANYISYKKEDENSDRVFALGEGERVLLTERRPGHIGKNRYNLPYEMPLDFATFYDAYLRFYKGEKRKPDELVKTIRGLCENIRDEDLKKKVFTSIDQAAMDLSKLEKIEQRVQQLI